MWIRNTEDEVLDEVKKGERVWQPAPLVHVQGAIVATKVYDEGCWRRYVWLPGLTDDREVEGILAFEMHWLERRGGPGQYFAQIPTVRITPRGAFCCQRCGLDI